MRRDLFRFVVLAAFWFVQTCPVWADGEPVPPVTDEDRAAAFPELEHDGRHGTYHGSSVQRLVMFDHVELRQDDGHESAAADVHGWIGGDVQRLWFAADMEDAAGEPFAGRFEAHYGRGVSAWWDLLTGVRHDTGEGGDRTAISFGVRGLAPWFVETVALMDVDQHGRTRLRMEFGHNLLLTNRLILQSELDLQVLGRDDPARGLASGFSSLEAGLRLRYEITRRFAPYVGVSHERFLADTRSLRHDLGEASSSTQWVAGIRIWF